MKYKNTETNSKYMMKSFKWENHPWTKKKKKGKIPEYIHFPGERDPFYQSD